MFKLLAIFPRRFLVLACIATLAACGGGGGGFSDVSNQLSSPASGKTYQITGAGIKGPLAFATVSIFALDTNFDELYDPNKPVATATTNAYAEISGLTVSTAAPDSAPPYILLIDGANAIDRNTNTTPVIKSLVTVITEESLAANRPVYATPYTTLAYQMLRQDISPSAGSAGSERGTIPSLATILNSYSEEIVQNLGFGIPTEIDIFTTSPIITIDTASIASQQQVVYHRAAIEAFSAIVDEMSSKTNPTIETDALIESLALDFQSDGAIDGAANGSSISGINTNIIAQNPMVLDIPNTQYLVSETPSLILEERELVGASANVPFYIDDISLDLDPIVLDAGNIGSTPPPVVDNGSAGDYLLYADFENRSIGAYAESAIRSDFQVNMNGYNESNWLVQYMEIVADPASSGRDNVLRVKRFARQGWAGPGQGGMQFRGDFTRVEDVYFAFDMYLAPGHEYMKQMKNPGLMFSTYDDVGHPDFNTYPTPDSLKTFVYTVSSDGNSAWGRGDGALNTYFYDKDVVSGNEFWDRSSPTFSVGSNTSTGGNQYQQPTGRWITVELRMKMNTVTQEGRSGLNDGLAEVWVTDSGLNGGAVTKVSSHNHKWRINSSIGIDGISMSNFYGGDGGDPDNQPSRDQYHYYDNFRVSTSPITH